jgi:hypothetical protein
MNKLFSGGHFENFYSKFIARNLTHVLIPENKL